MKYAVIIFALLTTNAQAKDVMIKDWLIKNETEVSLVTATGNTKSETHSAKHLNKISKDKNLYQFSASYLRTKTNNTETGKYWNLGLRYERGISESFSAYLGYKTERNIYAGYIRRNSVDLGGKYFFKKSKKEELFAELGVRSTEETLVAPGGKNTIEYGRAYTEWTRQWSESLSSKIWVEYLQGFDDSEDYFLNHEVSITTVLSSLLSLKLAYLTKYQNRPGAGFEKTDRLYTTALVAKF